MVKNISGFGDSRNRLGCEDMVNPSVSVKEKLGGEMRGR